MNIREIEKLLGDEAKTLLEHQPKISRERLHLPGPDFVDRIWVSSDRSPNVLRNLQLLFNTGRLGNSGYVSILPVDQGIEHSAGASFAPNPDYFDPENIVKLAIAGGCNGVASTLGILGACSRKYAHKIPFILKINHNEFLSYPNTYDQILFANVKQAFDMGAVGVGATIYFGSEESKRQLQEITHAFQQAHELGMFTILWCYLRNPAFKTKEKDYHVIAADLHQPGQSPRRHHRGRHHQAEIARRIMAVSRPLKFGKYHPDMYTKLCSDHPIDLTRYQVANCYMGRCGPDQLRAANRRGHTDLG